MKSPHECTNGKNRLIFYELGCSSSRNNAYSAEKNTMILAAGTSMAVVTTVESNSSLDVKKETC